MILIASVAINLHKYKWVYLKYLNTGACIYIKLNAF